MKSPRPSSQLRLLIGYAEFVDLPEWDVRGLRAKVDTGARSSALHVTKLKELPRNRVRFSVILGEDERPVAVEAPVSRRARVRSSTGHAEDRIFVRTTLQLGPVQKEIELSLAQRGEMRYRMLLGRTALGPEFLVDVSHRYTTGSSSSPRKKTPTRKRNTR